MVNTKGDTMHDFEDYYWISDVDTRLERIERWMMSEDKRRQNRHLFLTVIWLIMIVVLFILLVST